MIGSLEVVTSIINRVIFERFQSKNRLIFFIVPILMLIIIIVFIPISHFQLGTGIFNFYSNINSTLIPLNLKGNFAVIIFSFFVLLSNPTNYFIRWLIQFKNDSFLPDLIVANLGKPKASIAEAAATQEVNDTNLVKAGKTIGILERWLFLFFVLINQYAAIGFIIAAKAVARFKNDDAQGKEFTEYSLIGTLYSTFFAVLTGAVLLKILSSK